MERKNLSAKQLFWFSLSGLLISLTIHLLTVLDIFLVPNTIIILITIGMLVIWLQSSAQIKLFLKMDKEKNPWKTAFALCPSWLKYLTYFFIIYALINFAFSAELDHSNVWFNLNVSQQRLRGLSGFWLAFYAFGLMISYATLKHHGNLLEK